MWNKVKRFLIATLAAAITFTAVPTTSAQAADCVQKYVIDKRSTEPMTIYAGQRGEKVEMVIKCGGAKRASYSYASCATFKSSNTKVLTVDENGNLTPIKAGKATITMESNGNTCKKVITVKDPKKSKTPVFEQVNGFEYGKKYQIRTLNGYKVKSIKSVYKVAGFKASKSTFRSIPETTWSSGRNCGLKVQVTFTNGKKAIVSFGAESKQHAEALAVVKSAMADMGITSTSSELEKITAVYNWLVLNTEYNGTDKYDGGENYYAILFDKKGDCEAYAQAIELFCEYLGIKCVDVNSPSHIENSVCIDGKWYLVDINGVGTPYWPGDRLLRSSDDNFYGVSSKSTYKGISFDNTEYDNKDEVPFFKQMREDYKDFIKAWEQKKDAGEEARYEATKDVVEYIDVLDLVTGEFVKFPRTDAKGVYLPEGYEGIVEYDEAYDEIVLKH
ncbi:MAG: hypothetical protein MRZ65_03860 [Lachnospiraceae bacterium]|nr:hypothetical protein [Lachnospiraceae bacterium]